MCATEKSASSFDAVSNHSARTVIAGRRQSLNRTFEAVECMPRAIKNDVKRLVIVIPAHFALGHRKLLLSVFGFPDSSQLLGAPRLGVGCAHFWRSEERRVG